MNKQQIYEYIKQRNIWYEITEHEAVFSMKEVSNIEIPYPEADAKNLFICDDKKRNYYLITIRGNKRANLKKFKQENNTRPLSFAFEKDLKDILGLVPGSVSPLGVLNNRENNVNIFIDKDFTKEPYIIGIHPNDNTATIWLKTKDLIKIIEEQRKYS